MYTPTIGLEVHAELKTKTKMFCDSKNDPHASEPNIHVCPVCLAHPGTLPVINKEAVKSVLKVGIAIKGELATYTEFDRKNYFYPDIPKGYQISQYLYPLVKGGVLADVEITRVHLEEDTARSLHDQGEGSIIDYNRAGVPLMELVTEPVIHDSKTAGNFARELQLLLRTLGVSDANMEKGEMRVEANISVSCTDTYGTKIEVKNLNSFKSVESAIEYEIQRQIELLEQGEKVTQETRGWDEQNGRTFSQRVKESAGDYRYFPDPDLPKLSIGSDSALLLSLLSEKSTILPSEMRVKYEEIGLPREQIEIIISDVSMRAFFDEVLDKVMTVKGRKIAANYLTSDILSILERRSSNLSLASANSSTFAELVLMLENDEITSRVAKDLLERVLFLGVSPKEEAVKLGLLQSRNEDELVSIVHEIIISNTTAVSEFKNGKEASLQFLIGQGMKATKGRANPKVLGELLRREIKQGM